MDRFGFSPTQGVFGKNLKVPFSLLTSDALNQELVEASAPDAIERAREIRDCAAKEWVKRQDIDAVKRSLRQSPNTHLRPETHPSWHGCIVYRGTPSYKGWTGPGVVIAEDLSSRSTWISTRP